MTRQVTTLPVTEKTVANGNWDTSRKTIDRVVIHTMVGTAPSADARFNNSTQQVSAHYGVRLDGSIWHWVDEDNTAYHAGNYAMNQRSIGIEHEDNGDYNGVRTDALYTTSAKLVKDICTFYNIPIDRSHIIKHSEVIATGCPDALDIDRIVKEASGVAPSKTITIEQKTFEELVTKATERDKFVSMGFNSPDDLQKTLDTNKKTLDSLTKKNQDLETRNSDNEIEISTLSKQIGSLTEVNEELKTKISTLEQQVKDNTPTTQTPPNQPNPAPDAPSQTTGSGISDTTVGNFFKAILAWLRGK